MEEVVPHQPASGRIAELLLGCSTPLNVRFVESASSAVPVTARLTLSASGRSALVGQGHLTLAS